jgi:hypothetical protein
MAQDVDHPRRVERRLVLALAIVTPVGFATKFWLPGWLPEPAGRWCLLYGAAVLYEIFWVLLLALVWPRLTVWRNAAIVFLVTCILECLQLVRAGWLTAVRGTFLGAALLGNGFDLWDFPHYLAGSAMGALLLARLRAKRVTGLPPRRIPDRKKHPAGTRSDRWR